jgi:hypothetical protein
MFVRHRERHRTERIGWLRAAVLGANDGILSTASLVLGVAAAHATHSNVLVAGVAGLMAGSMSMAAGEYVSVHSQADTEKADLALERAELKADDKGEHKELTGMVRREGDPTQGEAGARRLHRGLLVLGLVMLQPLLLDEIQRLSFQLVLCQSSALDSDTFVPSPKIAIETLLLADAGHIDGDDHKDSPAVKRRFELGRTCDDCLI